MPKLKLIGGVVHENKTFGAKTVRFQNRGSNEVLYSYGAADQALAQSDLEFSLLPGGVETLSISAGDSVYFYSPFAINIGYLEQV